MQEDSENPIEYQAFNLSFRCEGAVSYFEANLPPEYVGAIYGQTGINQFYLAILDFHRRTGLDPIDPIAFTSWLETETDIYASLGGAGAVSVFIDLVTDGEMSTPEAVTGVLKYRAKKRKQIDSLQELQLLVTKKEHKSDEDLNRINFLTDQIRSLENEIGYDPLAGVSTASQIGQRAESLWELPDFLPTQFRSLNRAMGYTDDSGFCKGAVHSVIAQSGRGKSTFCKCLMNHWVDIGYRVLYVNFEEAVAHWERILFTQVTGQNVYKGSILNAYDRRRHTEVFQSKMLEWGDRFLVKHDPDTPYFDDLERWLRDINGHGDAPDAVFIDTIQSMFLKATNGRPRWGEYEEMMARMEKLAKDMNTALIFTAQENAKRMNDRREVAQQTDIGGSLAIAQKCAITIFITDKKLISGDDSEDEHLMQLQIPKNRITGDSYTMDPPLVRYNDDTKSYEEVEPVDESLYDPTITLEDILRLDGELA